MSVNEHLSAGETSQASQTGQTGQAPQTNPAPLAQRIRRWVVGAIIVSFGIAALGGIAVLLSGAWSDTAGKVLGTTAITGLFSVAVLCGVALIGKPAQWFGWVTVGISVATLARLLWQIWTEFQWQDRSFEVTITMCVLTAACAVASLLLLLVAHDRQVVHVLLYVTLGMIGLGVLLSLLAVWQLTPSDEETYWRSTGVIWILAALGTVVLPVMSLLLRANKQPEPVEIRGSAQPLSPESIARIEAVARAAEITPDELVHRLLP